MKKNATLKKAVVLTGLWFAKVAPFTLLSVLARIAGALLWIIPNEVKRITLINLHLCYPNTSKKYQRQLAKRVLFETIVTFLDIAKTWQSSSEKVLARIQKFPNLESIQKRIAQHKGAIILVPHIGNWEVLNVFLSHYFDFIALYRPPKLVFLENIIKRAREKGGTEMVPTNRRGVKRLFQALTECKVLGVLPDQDPGDSGGVFAPVMGIEANTMTLVSKLAQKHNLPVYMIYAKRLGIKDGYEISTLTVEDTIYSPDIQTSIQAIHKALEQCITEVPEQYQWTYKRFKRRPPGELDFYNKQHGLKP